ncbi:MAG TPA: AI-2E family transporter [Candidatus Acidoferrales bacterium]|nr:AI-2E family transporter [Candidatus Acidoferrales bacterium]
MPARGGLWKWFSERNVTYALKVLMLLVLAFFAGEFVVNVLERISGVMYVLIGSTFLAYIIYPAIAWMRRRLPRVPLALAIAVVYAVIVLALALFAFFLLPQFVNDFTGFVAHYPVMVDRFHHFVNDPNDPVASHLPLVVRHLVARIPSELALWLQARSIGAFTHIVPVLFGAFAVIATFVLIPMLTAYLILDLDNLKASLSAVVPPERWRATLSLLADFDAVVGGFVRGQMLVAASVGVLITIAMLILHVRYAFLLGLIAGIGDLIPYVGAVLAFVPAFASAITDNGIVNALLVAAAFVLIFEAEGHFLAPNIVSKTVRLSPFAVLLALLIGGSLAGLAGVLIAVPVAGVLRVIALRVFPRPKENAPP